MEHERMKNKQSNENVEQKYFDVNMMDMQCPVCIFSTCC